jgi:hypothetical protein
VATETQAPARPAGTGAKLLIPVAIGAVVSLTLGLFGRLHKATNIAVDVAGFTSPLTVKVWMASVAFLFGLIQFFSALVMYGRIPGVRAPSWIGGLHRWSGRIAFLVAVPVAMHCLYALGFQSADTRVLIHSLLGCLFFGFFTVKMLVLPKPNMAGWVLPVLGGVVFTILIGLWLTSSLWFFTNVGVKF